MKAIIKILYKIWKLLSNRWKIIFGVLILIGIGILIGRYTTAIKTIEAADSSAAPIFTIEIDTTQNKKTMDSLWAEAKAFWDKKTRPVKTIIVHDTITGKPDTVFALQKINYIASTKKDTVINDGHLRLKLSLVSPIPIHPDSYFRYEVISEYTEPVIPKSWLHDSIIYYMGVGLSSNGSELPKPTFQIGVGINLKSIF